MAYNLLKMHRKALMRLGMDDILQYLQVFLFYLIIFIKKHLSHYSLQSSTLQMNFQKKIVSGRLMIDDEVFNFNCF